MNDNDGRTQESRRAAVIAPASWLHLAATPTFALMALLTGTAGAGPMDMLCPAAHAMSPLGGMTAMYLLMAAFHSTPWLKLCSRWWHRV